MKEKKAIREALYLQSKSVKGCFKEALAEDTKIFVKVEECLALTRWGAGEVTTCKFLPFTVDILNRYWSIDKTKAKAGVLTIGVSSNILVILSGRLY